LEKHRELALRGGWTMKGPGDRVDVQEWASALLGLFILEMTVAIVRDPATFAELGR